METALDFLSSLLDEIALEGLDGITLPMLWVRLQNRPHFPLALDDDSKVFLWECIAIQKDIEIYELPEPREFVPIYNRYDHIDTELGIVVEPPEKLPDPYPIEFVKDGEIRGSCTTYKTRKCVTNDIRYDDVLLMSLNQVTEKWGESLVLVSSPKSRLLALIGSEINPLIDMSLEEYCLLERIGRSRYLGEVTQGEGGLLMLKARFCKQLHYYRKKLTLKGLLTKQLHYAKNKKGQATTGSLFHLTRFYVQRKTKMESLMKCMCDILKEKPQQREVCKILRQELGIKETTFKKLFYRPFQKWVKVITLPYREFYPNATQKESFTNSGQERIVKAVQLLRHCGEGDKEEEEEEEANDGKEVALPQNVHFDCSKIYHDIPLIAQAYFFVKEAGPEGISAGDIGRAMTLPRLDVRTLLRTLIKKEYVVTVLQDRGRQKVTKYICKTFEEQNEAYSRVKEEVQLSKECSSTVSSNLNVKKNLKRKAEESGGDQKNVQKHKRVRFDDNVKEVIFERDEEKEVSDNGKENLEESNFQNIISQVLEMQNTEVFTGKSPKLVSFSDKPTIKCPYSSTTQLTYRKLKRSNMIIEYLKSAQFSTITDLQKFLIEKEKEEGYSFKLDKKSTARLVYNLYSNKKIKIFKAVLKLGNDKTEIEFICDPSLKPTDPCIQVAIEQAKFKYFSVSRDKSKKPDQNAGKSNSLSKTNESENDNSQEKPSNLQPIYRTIYHSQPKFLRIKTLHQFLYYLVYQYQGKSYSKTEPQVYYNNMSWKRFVPPLPDYGKPGWCFVADIFSRMPLSIFYKVVNLRHEINDLKEYLDNEEKANYLIKHLPQKIRNNLLNNRKYLFSTDDVIRGMCYMGLVTMGPQVAKQKDQLFIYVHKNATIKDTTISSPGYIHINSDLMYEVRTYSFNSMSDILNFWADLESTCFHTPLGKYSAVAGKTIAITEASHKPELMESVKHRNFDEICDDGHVPGDGLGAAGFDSALFLHSRRNWQSSNSTKLAEKLNTDIEKPNATVCSYSIQHLLNNKEIPKPENRSRLQRLSKNTLIFQKSAKIQKEKSNIIKKKKIEKPSISLCSKKRRRTKYRTVKLRKHKTRTPYYDEKDKAAIKKMSKARCEWFAQEDSFLLLCKVASSFLDPTSRTLVVPYTVVRDLLHEHLPKLSANKSSRACQRRVRYMMLNPTTTNNVAVFLGEAKQDLELVKEFEKTKPSKSQEEVWKNMFTTVLNKLLKKFTLPASDRCKNITLPNSMAEFNERFEIIAARNVFNRKNHHSDPSSEEEVKHITLYSLIVAAMAIVGNGTEWSYLLHKLYQTYPETVLRAVVNRLRSEKIIAVKKRSFRKDLQRSLTCTFPYRFSITYENTMITKFPIKLFAESKELLDSLKNTTVKSGIQLKGDIAPGFTAAILSLTLKNELSLETEIPEQVILFDTSLSKEVRSTIVERMIHTLSDKETVELSLLLNNESESSLTRRNTREAVEKGFLKENSNDERNKNADEESLLMRKTDSNNLPVNEIQRSSNASRFALYLLRQELSQPPIERVQHSQDYIVLNSCHVTCHLKTDDNSTSFPIYPPEITENVLESQNSDFRLKEKTWLTDECISEILSSVTFYIPSEAFSREQNYAESLRVIYQSYSPEILCDAECILDHIYKANVLGISERELWQKCQKLAGELSLFEHLHLFREAILVLRVGVTAFTYVFISFAESWVISSYLLPESFDKQNQSKTVLNISSNLGYKINRNYNSHEEQLYKLRNNVEKRLCSSRDDNQCEYLMDCSDNITESDQQDNDLLDIQNDRERAYNVGISLTKEVYFIPRTWRHPDGTLNKPVFFELLSTVLSYIISSPGTTSSRVCERFSLVLQPVQTLELVEILEKSYCICKYFCKPTKKRTLFSSQATLFVTEKPEFEDVDHLEPLPDAICKIARLQDYIS